MEFMEIKKYVIINNVKNSMYELNKKLTTVEESISKQDIDLKKSVPIATKIWNRESWI